MVPAGNALGLLSRKSHLLRLIFRIFSDTIKFEESIYRGQGKRNEINHIICVKFVTLINFAWITILRIVGKIQFRAAYPQAGRKPARLLDAGLLRTMLHQDALQSMF